jgi:hypothetical protein
MVSVEYVPARLRSAFREQARGIVLHDIERMWRDEGFAPVGPILQWRANVSLV